MPSPVPLEHVIAEFKWSGRLVKRRRRLRSDKESAALKQLWQERTIRLTFEVCHAFQPCAEEAGQRPRKTIAMEKIQAIEESDQSAGSGGNILQREICRPGVLGSPDEFHQPGILKTEKASDLTDG